MGSSHTSSTAYVRGIGACLHLSIAVNAFLNTAVCFVFLVIMPILLLTLGDQPSPAIANLLRSFNVLNALHKCGVLEVFFIHPCSKPRGNGHNDVVQMLYVASVCSPCCIQYMLLHSVVGSYFAKFETG